MKISGAFVMKEECIHTLYAMPERRRMDYLLGLDEDCSFEEYIVNMEDYIETPEDFYKTVASNVLESNILTSLEMECVYKQGQNFIYILHPDKWSVLCDELKRNNHIEEKITDYFQEPKDRKVLHAISLQEIAKSFIDLIKSEHKRDHYMIMVFHV